MILELGNGNRAWAAGPGFCFKMTFMAICDLALQGISTNNEHSRKCY